MESKKKATIKCTSFFEIEMFDEIKKQCLEKQFQKGDFIVVEGDELKYLPIVLEGVVRLDCSTNTKDFLLDYLIAGDVCATSFSHIDINQKAVFSAQALTPVKMALISISEIDNILSSKPEFVNFLLSQTSKKLLFTLEIIKDLQSKNIEERLLKYLEVYKLPLSHKGFHLTHQQMSIDLGVSRETITRTLSKIKR